MKTFIIASIISLTITHSIAQSHVDTLSNSIPEVGMQLPDFQLNHVTHFKKSKVTNQDFRGKWLILDFWFMHCSSCIHNLFKISELHIEFNKQVTFLMVGVNDHKNGKNVEQFYEKLRLKRKLNQPSAYDSVLVRKWGIQAMPHIIIVDPSGVVRVITDGRDMTNKKIGDLINDQEVSFNQIATLSRTTNKLAQTEIIQTKKNLVSYSSISLWDNEPVSGGLEVDHWIKAPVRIKEKGYYFSGVSLNHLYNYAYRGQNYWDFTDPRHNKIYALPLLEIKDSSAWHNEKLYNYDLIFPPQNVPKEELMAIMQADLRRAFGYEAIVESRSMPVWKLIATPKALKNLSTKEGQQRYASPSPHILGYTLINWPKEYLMASICFYFKDKYTIPFVDETGFSGNFDFSLEADMTDFNDVKKALQKQGLDLIKGTRIMEVLVIKDSSFIK
jgi:uncharacterized protein (TIGR03435 family)